MDTNKRLTAVYNKSEKIPFDDESKIVFMSDCHRGDGSWADDFSKNQNLYFAALTHYYNEDYTYFELGDGDELWKNKNLSEIINTHNDAFSLLSRFYNGNRLFFLYGNHDIIKKGKKFANCGFRYYDDHKNSYRRLFEDAELNEGLVLEHNPSKKHILLVHGHQADYFNDKLWRLGRFLVRYFWKPLELVGIQDPMSTAKNHRKKELVERHLIEWANKQNCILIAGHTHRPVFPHVGEHMYFNDGSCVHPRNITAIEITGGEITLVKWEIKTKSNGVLYVGRDIVSGPEKLENYFNTKPMNMVNSLSNIETDCR